MVYKITNTINGNFYIGVTARTDIRRRISEHFCHAKRGDTKGRFYRALLKYPREAFLAEIIDVFDTCEEAFLAEEKIINELNPPYNSTAGGGGRKRCSVPHLTEEGARRISEFQKGKKWRLGAKQSEETKMRLRDLGIENKAKFLQYSHLGPKMSSIPVVCIETGERHESARAAGRFYGIHSSCITELCKGNPRRKSAQGKTFRYEIGG